MFGSGRRSGPSDFKTHIGRIAMHLPPRKCNLLLNSLTALSHGEGGGGGGLLLLSVGARTFGEIRLAGLENPLQVEKKNLNYR